jgi:predicted regulator of Ras-like GTPase activity (Roadblock/LC7/MglB family)
MPFKQILTELVAGTPGATGAILVDWEGEAVELACGSVAEYDLKLLAAHKGIILDQVREVSGRFMGAASSELVVTTGTGGCIVGTVGAEYALVMTFHRDALVGRALHRFRNTVQQLIKEIY